MTPKYYIVSGFVRDELLGIKSKDIDFAVEAESYEAMKEDILSNGNIIFQERPEYFSIRARHPEYGGVDYTLCRKDGFYSDNRRPDSVEMGTIFDDLARRDFTVNAIAKQSGGAYIDPHNGRADLQDKLLRCVGIAQERFEEDPLRLLRAVRFHIVKGFQLDYAIDRELRGHGGGTLDKLVTLPIERVYEELYKCYVYDTWATMRFFNNHSQLANVIHLEMGLGLLPRIYAPVAQSVEAVVSKAAQ